MGVVICRRRLRCEVADGIGNDATEGRADRASTVQSITRAIRAHFSISNTAILEVMHTVTTAFLLSW